MAATYSAVQYMDQLIQAGVPETVARIQAQALDEVDKAKDIKITELRDKLFDIEHHTNHGFDRLESLIRSESAATRSEMKALGSDLRKEIAEAKSDMIRWTFTVVAGFGLVQTGFITALALRLFPFQH